MMEYPVFKAKILTKSSIKIANASLFEILLGYFRRIVASGHAEEHSGKYPEGKVAG